MTSVFSKGTRSYLRGHANKLIAEMDKRAERDFDRPERFGELFSSMKADDIAARERQLGRFGLFSRQEFLAHAPAHVLRNLKRSRLEPWRSIKGVSQGVSSIDGTQPLVGGWTAVTASATETNLWVPAFQTAIPANSIVTGKVWHLVFEGIGTTTATQGTLTFTFRYGQSTTPASNVSMGASNAIAPAASLTNFGWWGEAYCKVLSTGVAASAATVRGWGFVQTPGAAGATSITWAFPISAASAATVDQTTAQGLIMSLTISVISQSYQCLDAWMESKN